MYATETELLERLTGVDAPENMAGTLCAAEALVQWYTSGALYATSADGTPYDPRIRAAFRDATLAQAESWVRAGIDPTVDERLTQTAKPLATSKSIRGASISYDVASVREAQAVRTAARTTLTEPAFMILSGAGLITAVVR